MKEKNFLIIKEGTWFSNGKEHDKISSIRQVPTMMKEIIDETGKTYSQKIEEVTNVYNIQFQMAVDRENALVDTGEYGTVVVEYPEQLEVQIDRIEKPKYEEVVSDVVAWNDGEEMVKVKKLLVGGLEDGTEVESLDEFLRLAPTVGTRVQYLIEDCNIFMQNKPLNKYTTILKNFLPTAYENELDFYIMIDDAAYDILQANGKSVVHIIDDKDFDFDNILVVVKDTKKVDTSKALSTTKFRREYVLEYEPFKELEIEPDNFLGAFYVMDYERHEELSIAFAEQP